MANLRMQHLGWGVLQREHSDIVFLPEGLRGLRNGVSGLIADCRGTLKAEEFA